MREFFDAEETQQSLMVSVITEIIRGQSSKSTGSGARSNHLLLRMQAKSSGENIELPGAPPGVFIACSFPGHSSTIARPQRADDHSKGLIFSNPCTFLLYPTK